MRLLRRVERLERLAPPPPNRAEPPRRRRAALAPWGRPYEAAFPLPTPAEQGQARGAVDRVANDFDGPFGVWLSDLCEGRSRLPNLSPEVMRDLLRAWLSPQADGGMVCNRCGLEYPRHQAPPTGQWKLLPGRRQGEGPPPWYDLPAFFPACPHCGGSRFDIDWPHLVEGRDRPWKDRDGYVGGPDRRAEGGPR